MPRSVWSDEISSIRHVGVYIHASIRLVFQCLACSVGIWRGFCETEGLGCTVGREPGILMIFFGVHHHLSGSAKCAPRPCHSLWRVCDGGTPSAISSKRPAVSQRNLVATRTTKTSASGRRVKSAVVVSVNCSMRDMEISLWRFCTEKTLNLTDVDTFSCKLRFAQTFCIIVCELYSEPWTIVYVWWSSFHLFPPSPCVSFKLTPIDGSPLIVSDVLF